MIGAIARALSIPVTELTRQPYLDDLKRDQLDGLIQPIREALDVYDLGADPDITPRPLPELHQHAEQLCALVRATHLKKAAAGSASPNAPRGTYRDAKPCHSPSCTGSSTIATYPC